MTCACSPAHHLVCVLVLALTPACGGGGGGSDGGTESTTEPGTGSTTAGDVSSETGDASTGMTGTGSDSETTGTGTTVDPTDATDATVTSDATDATVTTDATATDTGELCPPPGPIEVDFVLTPGNESVSSDCVVMTASPGPTITVELLCGVDPYTLELTADPALALTGVLPGAEVELDYIFELAFNPSRWLSLRRKGGWPIVGAVAAADLDPPGQTLSEFFAGEPAIVEAPGMCEPEQDQCGEVERVAVDLTTLDEYTVRVHDHGEGYIDVLSHGYHVLVELAELRPLPHDCTDLPERWFELAFTWFPSD